jgi:hypothetical protein
VSVPVFCFSRNGTDIELDKSGRRKMDVLERRTPGAPPVLKIDIPDSSFIK